MRSTLIFHLRATISIRKLLSKQIWYKVQYFVIFNIHTCDINDNRGAALSTFEFHDISSNGGHYGPIFFKPEKNLEFFRLKNWPIDDSPGRLE